MAKQQVEEVQPWQLYPAVELLPAIKDKNQQQSELIRARQNPGFPVAGGQVAHLLVNRAAQGLFDYTQQGVAIRYLVDGNWEPSQPLPRDAGDAMLVALKILAGANPQDRRSPQMGKVLIKKGREKLNLTLQTQGVPTGERVLVKIEPEKIPFDSLAALGMRDKMVDSFRGLLNGDGGLVVVSAPKGYGLSTSWRVAMEAADKFVRDFQAFEPEGQPEPEVININPNFYDKKNGPKPKEVLRSVLLKEPDVLVLPEIPDEETLKEVCRQVSKGEKHAYTRIVADDAIDAVVKLVRQYPGAAADLVGVLQGVLNQRLIRRLCENCKQGFQPPPALLQRLGIPAGKVALLYQPFVPPPIEQQVDEKGRPAPIPPCPNCLGRGYFGRIAIFELLTPGPKLKKALLKTADHGELRRIAKEEGHLDFQAEATLLIARGLTSIDEVRRLFASK